MTFSNALKQKNKPVTHYIKIPVKYVVDATAKTIENSLWLPVVTEKQHAFWHTSCCMIGWM